MNYPKFSESKIISLPQILKIPKLALNLDLQLVTAISLGLGLGLGGCNFLEREELRDLPDQERDPTEAVVSK